MLPNFGIPDNQAATELQALTEQSHDNPKLAKRIGRLLLDVGAAKESSDQFRELLRQDKQDAEAYAGLGQAEFAQHNYRSAQEAFRNALRWKSEDETLQKHFELCNQILALDPTPRGLSSAERNRRGRSLLERTVHASESCFAQLGNLPSESLQALLESARKALGAKPKQRAYSENTEAILIMVEDLWEQCEDQCRTSFEGDEVLSRVVAKLSLK